ncbi:MAG: extracellular solute-binding protein [Deinococcus sp.]|nr:extracellular solute-binding protein [Deinococcus sp.]
MCRTIVRFIGFLAAVVGILGTLGYAQPREITVMGGTGLENVYRPLFDQFEQQSGIKVNTQVIAYANRFDAIATAAVSGVATFDVADVDVIWTPAFAAAGWLVDVTEQFPDLRERGVAQASIDSVEYQGRIWGVPFFNSAKHFYYNQGMLEAAGFTRPPQTLDELMQYSIALTHGEGDNKVYGSSWSWVQDEALVVDWVLLAYAVSDVPLFTDDGQPQFTQSGGVQALQWMVDMVNSGSIDPASLSNHEDEVSNTFLAGKAAMEINWEGLPAAADADNPDKSKIVGQLRRSLIPAQPPIVSSTVLGPEGLAIMANSTHQAEALEFLNFILSEDLQRQGFIWGGFFPIYDRLYNDPELAAVLPQFSLYGEQFTYAHPRPKLVNYIEVADVIREELHSALLGQKTPQQALDDATQRIAAL